MNYIGFRPLIYFYIKADSYIKLYSSGFEEDSEKDISIKVSILGTDRVLSILDILTFRGEEE